ncbi:PAS domain S-box protein [Natrialbaceae archaeon A-arb3/5]
MPHGEARIEGISGGIPETANLDTETVSLLFVEDDETVSEQVVASLERNYRFEVDAVTEPRVALRRLEDGAVVDCLVSGYELPGMNGLDLLRAVTNQFPSIPFVLFAAQDTDVTASQALQQGADDYLRREGDEPCSELLAARVQTHVTNARQRHRLRELSATAEDAGHAITITDREGTITYVNEAMTRISRYDAEELLGETPAVFESVDRDRPFDETVWETIQDGDTWQGDAINERKDGSQYVVEQTIRPLTDIDGTITGFIALNRDVTDRKDHDRELRMFRQAVEHAGHGVMITDTDGTIEYVNEAFEQMSGYTREDVLGETPALLSSGEHDDEFYEDLWNTVLEGDIWRNEIIDERKDGHRYVIDQTIAPITDDDGSIQQFVAINQDVTARKVRERDLTFLKQAIDQAGIGIGTYGPDGTLTYVNERLAEIAGTEIETVKGKHVTDVGETLDLDCFDDYWNSFEEDERRVSEGATEQFDTGEVVPTEVISSRVIIDGDPYQVASVREITERKERERELERFREAVEYAGHGVMITDIDGTIEYVNEAVEETTGYSAAEILGQTPRILKSNEHDRLFYEELWGTILNGDVWRGEIVNQDANGRHYVIDQTIAPITDEDGDPTEFVAINHDITDLKEYERELEAQNKRLEQYGETVAHDLRNPLTLLAAELEQLRTTIERNDAELTSARQACANCRETVAEMRSLIDDLLEMAKQGQLVLDSETTNIGSVADAAWEQFETGDEELQVTDTVVAADPERLRELLLNLFRNALEHGGDGVTVRIGPLSYDGGFYVEDDGPGIPDGERDNVLERGYTTDEHGTGFGLAIVTEIALAHEWQVDVTESRDGGARFEIRTDEGR